MGTRRCRCIPTARPTRKRWSAAPSYSAPSRRSRSAVPVSPPPRRDMSRCQRHQAPEKHRERTGW